jgi:hypothetical protein
VPQLRRAADVQIDEELMSASGAFSLDQACPQAVHVGSMLISASAHGACRSVLRRGAGEVISPQDALAGNRRLRPRQPGSSPSHLASPVFIN